MASRYGLHLQSCPSLWRVYVYLSAAARQSILAEKRAETGWAKEAVGGESHAEYCYNCARVGHLGDVSSGLFPVSLKCWYDMIADLIGLSIPPRLPRSPDDSLGLLCADILLRAICLLHFPQLEAHGRANPSALRRRLWGRRSTWCGAGLRWARRGQEVKGEGETASCGL